MIPFHPNLARQIISYDREQPDDTRHDKRRRRLRRVVCICLLFLFVYCAIRQGINAVLALRAEGELQTASSYQAIYQSFERVEMKQLHLRKKWENHRGINPSLKMSSSNLMSQMYGGMASSVMDTVRGMTGHGGYGIGQYHKYVTLASSGSTGVENGTVENVRSETGAIENDPKYIDPAEPDQFIVHGEYIYTIFLDGNLSEGWMEPHLVVFHAVGDTLEQVYRSEWRMPGGYETEMMISGNTLYLAMNGETYDPEAYNVEEGIYEGLEHCLVYVYDITDPAKPQRKDTLMQSGAYHSMKMCGDYLYIFSKYQNFEAQDKEEEDFYVPMVGEEKIAPEQIYMQRDLYGTGYVVISSYRTADGMQPELIDARAVAGTAEVIQYTGKFVIYICSNVVPKNHDRTDRTGVTVLFCDEGNITGRKHLIVRGHIDMAQETEVAAHAGDALFLPMQIGTYRNSFVTIPDWILPGWESVPLKIQMGESAETTKRRWLEIDRQGELVQILDIPTSKQQIRESDFEGTLLDAGGGNYIGIGHTGQDKNVKLLWYVISESGQVELKNAVSLREYQSPASEDGRMVYLNQERCLIGFSTTGSVKSAYYLYRYQLGADGTVDLQQICQEKFGRGDYTSWIRGTMLSEESDYFYLFYNGGIRIEGRIIRLDQ